MLGNLIILSKSTKHTKKLAYKTESNQTQWLNQISADIIYNYVQNHKICIQMYIQNVQDHRRAYWKDDYRISDIKSQCA